MLPMSPPFLLFPPVSKTVLAGGSSLQVQLIIDEKHRHYSATRSNPQALALSVERVPLHLELSSLAGSRPRPRSNAHDALAGW
jgi:hypothetical protein